MDCDYRVKILAWNLEGDRETWDKRKEGVYQFLHDQKPDIFILQRVRQGEKAEMKAHVPGYVWMGDETSARSGCVSALVLCLNESGEDIFGEWINYDFSGLHEQADKVVGSTLGTLCILNIDFPDSIEGRQHMAENLHLAYEGKCFKQMLISATMNPLPGFDEAEFVNAIKASTGTVCLTDEVAAATFKSGSDGSKSLKLDFLFAKGLKLDGSLTVHDNIVCAGCDLLASRHFAAAAVIEPDLTLDDLKTDRVQCLAQAEEYVAAAEKILDRIHDSKDSTQILRQKLNVARRNYYCAMEMDKIKTNIERHDKIAKKIFMSELDRDPESLMQELNGYVQSDMDRVRAIGERLDKSGERLESLG